MIGKKLAFFAGEALKRATDTMRGLSDIKMTELLQTMPRYLVLLSPVELDTFTSFHVSVLQSVI